MAVREKYQFRIESIIGNPLEIITNPEGWKDFELRLKRDDDIVGLLVSSTNKFTFKDDGYNVLKNRFDDNYNDKVRVAIDILQADNTYIEQYNGVVILTNVLFNLEKRTAETTIEDANFQGAISGNKNIKMFLDTDLTKNGEVITAIERFNLDYFIADGTYQSLTLRRAYLYKDALDLLVRYMTDDEVKGVQSIYLDDTDNFKGALPYITNGVSINSVTNTAPNVSFSELIIFLSKTHDLTFDFVTDTNGDPVMRIEERDFFFGSSSSETFRDLTDLTVEIDKLKISSHIEVGNNNTFPGGNCSSTTRWFSFQKEDYALRGKGNVDNLIDLTTDFITDSNVIEEIVVNSTTDWEDNIFVVLGNTTGTQAFKFQSTAYCSNSFFYNLEFTNDNIISRQLNALPESVTKFLVGGTTPSKALTGAQFIETIAEVSPLPIINPIGINVFLNFTDLIYDFGSNYIPNPLTINGIPVPTFYDVPFEGAFSFFAQVTTNFAITDFPGITGDTPNVTILYEMKIERWNAAFTVLKESQSPGITQLQFGHGQAVNNFQQVALNVRTRVISLSATMNCDTSDKIVVRVFYTVVAGEDIFKVKAFMPPGNATFKCLGADEDTGVFKVFDPNTFRARRYKFEKNLPLTQSNNIRNNARSSIVINELSDTMLDKNTWIEEMVNNIETGATSFTTIN